MLGPIMLAGAEAGMEYNFCERMFAPVPPTIVCPSNLVVDATNVLGNKVEFRVTASDELGNEVPVDCRPPSGSVFPPGTTPVICVATNESGLTNSCQFTVTVVPCAKFPQMQW